MENGKSPPKMLFGRQLRDPLPCIASIKQKANFDLRHKVKDLPTPEPGQDVWTQECYS